MYGRGASAVFLSLLVVCLSAGVALGASAGDVVINEIWVNSPDYYDDAEFIELYNTTGSYIDLSGWVLSGTEYDAVCGEHHHQIPAGKGIDAYGYFVIARDVLEVDGFEARFGFLPDLEMYDGSQVYEPQDPRVDDTICQNPDAYDDQIRLFPGTSDYGMKCPSTFTGYEALWLYDEPTRSNLIDAVEYRQSSCTSDACAGVNGTNDAYPRYPDEGVSLGRIPVGTDTDDCSVDFEEQAPTPRAQNTSNLPPYGYSLQYSPCVPSNTDQVTITVYGEDDDGTVAAVKCFYSVRVPPDFLDTPFDSVAMTPVVAEPNQWEVDLPAQGDEYQVRFYVRITDDLGATGYEPDDAPNNDYGYSVGTTAISSIQQVFGADDSSYVLGQAKNIEGIVTVSRGGFGYPLSDAIFVVEDPNGGPWSGIFVYDPSYSVQAEVGDSVTISGFVSEYYNVTELYMFTDCYQEHKSGARLPDPFVITTGDLNTASATAERYEGVLVRIEGAIVTEDSLGNGEWEINDGSGSCIVDDAAYYAYVPQDGDSLDSIQGIGYYSFTTYKIEPRSDDDIVGPVRIYEVRYTPHVPTTTDVITVSGTVLSDAGILSVKLFHSTDNGANWDSTVMTSPDSVYTANIGPYAVDQTVVDYYVEAWNADGFSARKPAGGSYDFRVGMNTIYQVQNVTPPADSSTYAGEPVNVSGIVTAAPGELNPYYFFIQNSYGGADKPDFDGVKVYERTGSVTLERGDSVTVSGGVWEYYTETEIAMFFPEAITVHSTGNTVPAPYAVTSGMIDSNEVYEGVLVEVNNGTVTAEKNTYGEWELSNTVPDTSCTVGDNSWYDYDPTLSESVLFVRGVMMFSYSKHMIEPRNIDDICAAGRAGAGDIPVAPQNLAMLVKPNPMMNGGVVNFALPTSGHVALKIYNVKGELVSTLTDKYLDAGAHKHEWDGTNTHGGRVSSGIYFVKLETTRGSLVNKVVVSR
ncbi:MAG: lamin tail domain-containing protein [Candidatus Eisenbacteria bacterium]